MKRITSSESYHKLKDLGRRQIQVLQALKKKPMSNRELSKFLRMPINQITPRTNELVNRGVVARHSIKYDKQTERNVIVWGLI